jgi:hypothetical protein
MTGEQQPNDHEKLKRQLDTEIPYRARSDTFDPCNITLMVEAHEQYQSLILKEMKPYVPTLVAIHAYRIQKEWFYRFFFEFNRCKMDIAFRAMFDYLCKAYPLFLAKNQLVKETFEKIINTKDILSKRFLMLAFLGHEPDIATHVSNLVVEDLARPLVITENPLLDFAPIKHLVLLRTQRLLAALPKLVKTLTLESMQQFNCMNIASEFIFRCINIYETGIDNMEVHTTKLM